MLNYSISMCLLLCWTYTISAQGITFEKGTWESVLAKAQATNRPIFVDAYTTWCGPCKWMAQEIFTQEEVGAYINAHFIAYKMDLEKGEGPAFASANKVNAFPTLLYFDSQGLLLHKAAGARNAEQLIQLCEDAMDPTKQVGTYHERYKEGVRDQDFLKQYVAVLLDAGEDYAEPFGLYWQASSETQRHSGDMLSVLAGITDDFSDATSTYTAYFVAHSNAYEEAVEAEIINYYRLQAYKYQIYALAQQEHNKANKAAVQAMLLQFPEARTDFANRWKFYKAALETPPKERKVARTRQRYFKTTMDMGELDELVWEVLAEGTKPSKKELKQALKWMERSTEADAHYYNMHMKADLLFRLGHSEAALPVAKEALVLAKKLNLNEEELQNTRILLTKLGGSE